MAYQTVVKKEKKVLRDHVVVVLVDLLVSLRIGGGWGSLVRLKLLAALGKGMDHFYVRMVGS